MRGKCRFCLALAAAMAVLAAGCSGRNATEKAAPGTSALKPASGHAGVKQSAGLKYEAPPDWISETPASSMRRAQYRLPRVAGDPEDAELAIFFFGGSGGGVAANIDRWIGQFQKPDGTPAADVAKTSHRAAHGIPLTVVDVTGTYVAGMGSMLADAKPKAGFRMLAAVAESGGGPWFFKLIGPAKTVSRWEGSFQAFLDTIE
jgi:hypothetical protein